MDDNERKIAFGKWNYAVALDSPDKDQAARGALILHRLVPAPDHGRGFRRDPETGFVYYSSEWLDDAPPGSAADAAKRFAQINAKAPE